MGYTCNSSTWEVVGGGSGVEGYPWLQGELEARLGSVRDLVSNNRTKPRAGEMTQRVRTLLCELGAECGPACPCPRAVGMAHWGLLETVAYFQVQG